MTDRVPHAEFPSDETLAAFIDGRLDPEMRRRVVEHIAACPECYDIVLGANEMHRAQSAGSVVPFRRSRVAVIAFAAAAVAAFIALLVGPLRERIMPHEKSGLAALAEVAPPERNIEGRLSGFTYRPLKRAMRGKEDDDMSPENIKLQAVTMRVAAEAEKDPTPANLHAGGVAQLMSNNDDGAIRSLESAVRATPSPDAALLNDLAAAYLSRAKNKTSEADYRAAYEAADRAFKLAPTADHAWNRALAIAHLHSDQEAQAWSDYLKLDATSPWAAEARKHLSREKP